MRIYFSAKDVPFVAVAVVVKISKYNRFEKPASVQPTVLPVLRLILGIINRVTFEVSHF